MLDIQLKFPYSFPRFTGLSYERVIQKIKTLGNYALYIQAKKLVNPDVTPVIYAYPVNVFMILELTKNRIVLTTPSDGIEVLTRINRVPDPLSSLTYANSSSSITLTWTDSQTEAVTGYKVIRKTVNTDNFTLVYTNTDNTTRTYEDTDVSTGGTYWYRVRAYNSNGDGTPSMVIGPVQR